MCLESIFDSYTPFWTKIFTEDQAKALMDCYLWCTCCVFDSLPNDKVLDVTKLRAFADNKLNVAKRAISLSDGVENTVGKGENAGYQHFLLFPQRFPKPSSLKSGLYRKELPVNTI